MARFALLIEYNGAPFHGWQRQDDLATVQGAIEAALGKLEADVPSITAAGRTDTGVHATGQVAHCDMAKDWDPFRLSEALNFHLKPAPVAILAAKPVDDTFHARFSALERAYEYRLIERRAPLTHEKGLAWRIGHELDIGRMRQAAAHLLGKHDFTTFRASECQADSPVRTLDEITCTESPLHAGREIRIFIRARSFLHNQVRSIVGTLERVGAKTWEPERVKDALEARNRAECGPVCPADGLYLARVGYEKPLF